MFIKALAVLIAGAGVAVPVSSAIKDTISPNHYSALEEAESIVRLEWVGKDIHKEAGKLINGLGEVIRGDKDGQSRGDLIGVEIHTSGTFKEDMCEKLGFDSSNVKAGLACEQSSTN
ncbi:hypothetical protein [Mycoplasma suis]|uniref:Uncharacterized protein n=2 Tax=Mycoplasma suis TaxID=57372 RepID=F0QQV3_MYCSL|nr:hypothetical protein [Mycoplasma suis]ADX97873.1 hypothetical protein MSU_0331 [Mycoplasma suis str. Illinois]CBZ40373.1 hypothetical protein MSUIS_02800 [Mycoplasma suis KI3806]